MSEHSELLASYQKILKMCTEHMDECPEFERKIIDQFDFEEKMHAPTRAHTTSDYKTNPSKRSSVDR